LQSIPRQHSVDDKENVGDLLQHQMDQAMTNTLDARHERLKGNDLIEVGYLQIQN